MLIGPLQVLRTRSTMRNVRGHLVAAGTRVRVVNARKGKVVVRIQPTATSKCGQRIIAPASAFVKTSVGRPTKQEN